MLQNLPQLLGHKIATFFGERTNYGVNPTSPSLDALNEVLKTYSLSEFMPYESYDPGVSLLAIINLLVLSSKHPLWWDVLSKCKRW
jgi:conjugal transfer ATP-binding protein TraC